ncbi:MAG: hypothetical protein WAQ98_16320 [Blastocatellia bacterium]
MKILKLVSYLLLMICLTKPTVQAQQPNDTPTIYRVVNNNATVNSDGHISIVNALNLQELIRVPFSKPSFILEITPDQKRAFVTQDYNFIGQGLTVFDLERGRSIGTLFDDVMVTNIKIGTDGLLWVLLNDLRVVLVNPNTLQTITSFTLPAKPRSIVFSADGNRAYVSLQSSQNVNISVFDVKTRRFIRNIFNLPIAMPIELRPMELAISPNSRILCYGAREIITVIDTDSFDVINSFNVPFPANFDIPSLLFSPDGNLLYIGQFNAFNISVFDFRSNQLTSIFNPIFNSTIQDLKLSSDGRLLYIGEFRGTIVFDIATRSVVAFIERFNVSQSAVGGGLVIAGNFNIGQAPTVQVTNPLANQQLTPGQNVRIQWQTTVAAQSFALANHRVELSTNGGQTFSTIAGAENLAAEAREFTWTVPNIQVANNAQIRVTAGDLGARRGSSASGNFSIGMGGGNPGDTQAPTVNFIAPTGGENFNSGSNLAISWISSDNVGVAAQDLSLSTDGGATFTTTLATGLPGSTQSFNFAIPQTLETNQARLRLIVRDAAGNMAQATTASNFRIQSVVDNIAPTVTISQPTTNQQVMAGQPIQVNWQSTDNRAVISQALLLSLDGGQSFTQVASFGATDSSFTLNNINNLSLTTPQAIVRITATDAAGNSGQANAQFTINPTITQAAFQAKILTINGIGFMSNGANILQLFINDKLITIAPRSVTNTTFTIKGNKKKLNLIKGSSNSVRLVVDGVSSNMGSFMF